MTEQTQDVDVQPSPWGAGGGPAFPVRVPALDGGMERYRGMALRDWLAGQALPTAHWEVYQRPGTVNAAEVARLAYAIADAMLVAGGHQ